MYGNCSPVGGTATQSHNPEDHIMNFNQCENILFSSRYVYNQIVSVLTSSQLNRIYEQRRNYDLRRLLAGAERLIDHLLNFMEKEPAFLLGAVKCLPLIPSVRDSITQTIIQTCGKIKVGHENKIYHIPRNIRCKIFS